MRGVAKTTSTRVGTVRDYIASKPKASRASLESVRRAILKAIPGVTEGIAYQMPAYTLNGVGVIYFAGWTSHYSLYPVNDVLAATFSKEIAKYERRKATLRFPLDEPVPVRLIERIAQFRAAQVAERHGKGAKRRRAKETQPDRVRRLCATLPSSFEKTSHGTPCFFVEPGKGCFAMLSEHYRDDGRMALWVPVPEGQQMPMIEEAPDVYFYPKYVGKGGWVGVLLDMIKDDALESHLRDAHRLIAAKRKPSRRR